MGELRGSLSVGAAVVSVLNVGFLRFSLAEVMNVPETEWRPLYAGTFEQPLLHPSQTVHMALPGASILVDPGDYDASAPPGSPYRPEGYKPPAALVSQLRQKGIKSEGVTHVIITHSHVDHYAGVTLRSSNGSYVPAFPGARYYLSRADWETPELQEALRDPESTTNHALGVIFNLGLLELVEGNQQLTPEVMLVAAPGETPGHQIARLHSLQQTLYCLGDLYHHAIEVEHPSWVVTWADPASNLRSRRALTEAAASENPILIPGHMSIGRIASSASGVKWVEVAT